MAEARWDPTWAVAPGEVLLEALEEREMSQAELARRTARPLKTINEIATGKAAVTPDTAIQFERALGISARVWLGLEAQYREAQARARDAAQLARLADWLKGFPVGELRKRGILDRSAGTADLASQLLSFFGVSSPDGWTQHWGRIAAQYRLSEKLPVSRESVAVWLRLCELQADEELPAFDKQQLVSVLPRLRAQTRAIVAVGAIAEARALLRRAGVGLALVKGVPGAPASGAVRWIAGNPWIFLTARHATDDQFWFSLFHEIGHVLETGRRRDVVEEAPDADTNEEGEREANQFAREFLVPGDKVSAWLRGNEITKGTIRALADSLGVSPGIVIGRLQRDGYLRWDQFRDLKRPIRPGRHPD